MRILKKGNILEQTLYRGTCRNCGCQIEFKYLEAEVVRDNRDGDFLRINCPTCTVFITVAL